LNSSDADPEVLAEYVVALLQADEAPERVKREECEDGLKEFLKGDGTLYHNMGGHWF
jgi:hypothetical protein